MNDVNQTHLAVSTLKACSLGVFDEINALVSIDLLVIGSDLQCVKECRITAMCNRQAGALEIGQQRRTVCFKYRQGQYLGCEEA